MSVAKVHPRRPQVTSMAVADTGDALTVLLSEPCTGNAGFDFSASGDQATFDYSSGTGAMRIFAPSRTILAGESITGDFSGNVVNARGTQLRKFSGFEVDNQSAAGAEEGELAPIIAPARIADDGLVVLAGQAIDFTPTFLRGESATWSQTGKPAEASFDTSTGRISGTLTTPGRYDVKLNAAIVGQKPDYIIFPIIVYSTLTTIDSAWLAANDPRTLTGAHTLYQLDADVDLTGEYYGFYLCNPNVYLDLNGHMLTYGGGVSPSTFGTAGATECGIILYLSWYNTEISTVAGASAPNNCAVFNGSIVNAGANDRSHCIFGHNASALTVEGVYVETDGKDSHTIWATWPSGGTCHYLNNHLVTNTAETFNRHAGPANIGGSNGPTVNCERNTIIGGNSGILCAADSIIRKNCFGHAGLVTNGYAMFIYRVDNVTVADNLILPSNGRGILCNGVAASTAGVQEGISITDNVILHWEAPNAEFGSNLNPPAVRQRYQTGGIMFSGNECLGIAGTGLTGASTIYLTNYGDGHYANIIEDNDCTTILVGSPSAGNKQAQPLTMEGQGNPSYGDGLDIIRNNVFNSNYCLVRVEGYDGYAQQGVDITGNEMNWVDGDTADAAFAAAIDAKIAILGMTAAVDAAADSHIATIKSAITAKIGGQGLQATRALWYAKFISHTGTQTYADLIDSTFNSVDSESYSYENSILSAGSVALREGFTATIQLLEGMTPIADTNVTVTSDEGDEDTYTTDGSGNVTITFYRYALEKANDTGQPFVLTNRVTSDIAVDGYATPATVTHSSVPSSIDIGAIQ